MVDKDKDQTERKRDRTMDSYSGNQRKGLVERVEEEGLDMSLVDPTGGSQTGPRGDSFINPALVGSGTIMPDGTYGPPLPDPNVRRVKEETSTDLDFPEGIGADDETRGVGIQKKTPAKKTQAPKDPEPTK